MSRSSAAAAAAAAARPALPPPRLSVPSSAAAASGASHRESAVPHFVIDLDLAPSQRWSAVVSAYRHAWGPMVTGMWVEYEVAARESAQEEMAHEAQEAKEAAAAENKAKAKAHKKAGASAATATPKQSKKDAAAARASELKARAKSYLDQQVAFAGNLATAILANFRAEGLAGYAEEIEALSALSGVSIRDLLLLNLSYEAHGGCTSVLVPLPTGEMMLGRTLDWNQESALRYLTVELSFMRAGKLLYRAASFAGFLGVFTAHVPHRFAVAVNFRCVDEPEEEMGQEEFAEGDGEEEEEQAEEGQDEDADADADGDESMESIFASAGVNTSVAATTAAASAARASASGGLPDSPSDAPFAYPVGYLVRHTLETCLDYAAATAKLSCAPLMSPAYFIVAGTTANQGTIITRDLHASVLPLQIDPAASRGSKSQGAESKAHAKKKQRGTDGGSTADAVSSSSSAAAASGVSAPASAAAAASSTPLGSLFNMARSFLSGSAANDDADADAAAAATPALATAAPSAAQIRSLPAPAPSVYPWLIQANMDHWLRSKKLDHQQSLPRVALANQALLSLSSAAAVDEESMWRLLAQHPIWDEETIYASVSIPARDRFVTLIDNPHPPPPRKKGAAAKRKGARKY